MSKNVENPVITKREVNYWTIEGDVSNGFNRLKAKLYNLIEASISDKQQVEALKGLIKGFANDEYEICIQSMRYDARCAEFLDRNSDESIPTQPLENIK